MDLLQYENKDMITQALICQETEGAYDPFRNLAIEKNLTFLTQEGQCILYLWQNRRTVVIGRNQNAWKECNVDALLADGGTLARRMSGGGAVFHDLGNLNFSFCVRKEDYDVDRQLEVIRRALHREGIEAVKSGRNDLLADGRKFSGNAFYKSGEFCCHHGTIMIDVNRDLIGRYLHVPERKLLSKGITSVQSRVINLKELCPQLTIDRLSAALLEAFSVVYGCEARDYREYLSGQVRAGKSIGTPSASAENEIFPDTEQIRKDTEYFASQGWIFGNRFPFTHQMEGNFSWGGIQILLRVEKGKVSECLTHSDAMDQEAILKLSEGLKGCMYEKQALLRRLECTWGTGSLVHSAGEWDQARRQMSADIKSLLEKELN